MRDNFTTEEFKAFAHNLRQAVLQRLISVFPDLQRAQLAESSADWKVWTRWSEGSRVRKVRFEFFLAHYKDVLDASLDVIDAVETWLGFLDSVEGASRLNYPNAPQARRVISQKFKDREPVYERVQTDRG